MFFENIFCEQFSEYLASNCCRVLYFFITTFYTLWERATAAVICCAVGELLKNFNFSSDPFELELKSLAVMEQGHVEDAVGNTAG